MSGQLRSFSTCQLSDALIALGYINGGYIPDTHPVVSSTTTTISGPAYTVKFMLATDKESPSLESDSHFLDNVPEGSIVFIQAPAEAKNAVWGSLMSAAAKSKGAKGVVISGRCRDLAELRSLNLPVFARGHSSVGQRPFTRPSAVNVKLTIEPQYGSGHLNRYYDDDRPEPRHLGSGINETENCGRGDADKMKKTTPQQSPGFPPVEINPGDEIIADEDGIVCVPKEMVDKVMEVARKGQEVDERCMQDILRGEGVKETFKKHRGK